ncbi:MAG: glycoside hydrolase family 65 protein, partial [bacterium]
MTDPWKIVEDTFDSRRQHHKETIFTAGNGFFCTRGAFEEGYPGDRRGAFAHGVFDAVPISISELANVPDWLPFTVLLDGERFSLDSGRVRRFERILDLRTGLLTRRVEWVSPRGRAATVEFERFASMADEHVALIRCRVTPAFRGTVEFRAALNGNMDNEGLAHWRWVAQGRKGDTVFLRNHTRHSGIEFASAMRMVVAQGRGRASGFWDVENSPTMVVKMTASPGRILEVDKFVGLATSRDGADPVALAVRHVNSVRDWASAFRANSEAWAREWDRTDVVIEGDDEAQLSVRFSLFQMLIAAPRHDDDVNIGAKTLSGFGYRGHSFWDTEIFMLPLFIYTAPHIAKNLLNYRFQRLSGARAKARANGCEGAQFPWESADTGEEVTPTWVPHYADRNKLARVWTGDIEIHVSADVAYATYLYWRMTGDDDWLIKQGAELLLDTAKFWASRAEWNARRGRYEYNDVIGPDENHEHVNNNVYINRMAQWNLKLAIEILQWLKAHAPVAAARLSKALDLNPRRLKRWRQVVAGLHCKAAASGLIEQFDGYFKLKDVDLATMEPRTKPVLEVVGFEGANKIQVIKQPDVLMLQYLLQDEFTDKQVRVNYEYYNARTDHTYGSSLGPAIQAVMACRAGRIDEAREHFIRAASADLLDVRGNAKDGIHAASAAGVWLAVVFGFAGLRVNAASTLTGAVAQAPGGPDW